MSRIYVKDWRSETDGVVKKALRIDIGEWVQTQAVDEGQMVTEEAWPDLEAVRHENQFGSPELPMMEIACTPEKSETVRDFWKENNIETWSTDLNPFLDPSVDPADHSQEADKKRFGHLTRVLVAWWKAAKFVQSRDTALFYHRLIKQAVKGADALHKWPNNIRGIATDARGVSDSKENPAINFEFVEGFSPPPRLETKRSVNPNHNFARWQQEVPCHRTKR